MAGRPVDEIWNELTKITIGYKAGGSYTDISTMFFDEALNVVSPAEWWSLAAIDSSLKEHTQRIL